MSEPLDLPAAPSPRKQRAAGAAKGAAKGAVKGGWSGAAKGAVSGARSSGARSGGAARKAFGGSSAVNIIKAEFVLCTVILALSPLADPDNDESIGDGIRRVAAGIAFFFVLALVAAGGPRAAKISAGLGGLVTISLCLASRDVFGTLASRITGGFKGEGNAVVGNGNLGPDGTSVDPDTSAASGTGPNGAVLGGNGATGLGPGGQTAGGQDFGGLGPGGSSFGFPGSGLGPGGV